jgi:hypothetical protein
MEDFNRILEKISKGAQPIGAPAAPASTLAPKVDDDFESLLSKIGKPSQPSTPSTGKLNRTSGNKEFDSLYEQAGSQYGVDPNLLLEQGRNESINFSPKYIYQRGATSPKGAGGIAQFIPDTARSYGLKIDSSVDERYDPAKAIPAQAKMMRKLIDRHGGNIEAALAAYNSGSGLNTADALRNRQKIPETRKYVDKITGALKQARADYAENPTTENLNDVRQLETVQSSVDPQVIPDSRTALRNELGLPQPTYQGSRVRPQTTQNTEAPQNPKVPGQIQAGNIDLSKRPVVKNPDGTISTVRSMSVNVDGKEILIPTVAEDGSRILSNDEAIEQYKRTGKMLGVFDTPENATAYAEWLHRQQEAMYGQPQVNADGTTTKTFIPGQSYFLAGDAQLPLTRARRQGEQVGQGVAPDPVTVTYGQDTGKLVDLTPEQQNQAVVSRSRVTPETVEKERAGYERRVSEFKRSQAQARAVQQQLKALSPEDFQNNLGMSVDEFNGLNPSQKVRVVNLLSQRKRNITGDRQYTVDRINEIRSQAGLRPMRQSEAGFRRAVSGIQGTRQPEKPFEFAPPMLSAPKPQIGGLPIDISPQARQGGLRGGGYTNQDTPLSEQEEQNREGQLQQMRESGRIMRPIYEGLQGSVGGTLTQLGNVLDLLSKTPQTNQSRELYQQARDYLRRQGKIQQQTAGMSQAEYDTPDRGAASYIDALLRVAGASPLEIAKILALPGGPVTKFAALGALENEDKGIAKTAEGAAKGALTGAVFSKVAPFSRPIRTGIVGAATAGIEKATGASNQQAATSALSNAAFAAMGGPGRYGAGDVVDYARGRVPAQDVNPNLPGEGTVFRGRAGKPAEAQPREGGLSPFNAPIERPLSQPKPGDTVSWKQGDATIYGRVSDAPVPRYAPRDAVMVEDGQGRLQAVRTAKLQSVDVQPAERGLPRAVEAEKQQAVINQRADVEEQILRAKQDVKDATKRGQGEEIVRAKDNLSNLQRQQKELAKPKPAEQPAPLFESNEPRFVAQSPVPKAVEERVSPNVRMPGTGRKTESATPPDKQSALDALREVPDRASFYQAVAEARRAGANDDEINRAVMPKVSTPTAGKETNNEVVRAQPSNQAGPVAQKIATPEEIDAALRPSTRRVVAPTVQPNVAPAIKEQGQAVGVSTKGLKPVKEQLESLRGDMGDRHALPPFVQTVLRSKYGAEALKEIPEGSRIVGFSAGAVDFQTPNGKFVRLGIPTEMSPGSKLFGGKFTGGIAVAEIKANEITSYQKNWAAVSDADLDEMVGLGRAEPQAEQVVSPQGSASLQTVERPLPREREAEILTSEISSLQKQIDSLNNRQWFSGQGKTAGRGGKARLRQIDASIRGAGQAVALAAKRDALQKKLDRINSGEPEPRTVAPTPKPIPTPRPQSDMAKTLRAARQSLSMDGVYTAPTGHRVSYRSEWDDKEKELKGYVDVVSPSGETETIEAASSQGNDMETAALSALKSALSPHHSQFQPRRVRGERKGQFKKGSPVLPEASVRSENAQPVIPTVNAIPARSDVSSTIPTVSSTERINRVNQKTQPDVRSGTADAESRASPTSRAVSAASRVVAPTVEKRANLIGEPEKKAVQKGERAYLSSRLYRGEEDNPSFLAQPSVRAKLGLPRLSPEQARTSRAMNETKDALAKALGVERVSHSKEGSLRRFASDLPVEAQQALEYARNLNAQKIAQVKEEQAKQERKLQSALSRPVRRPARKGYKGYNESVHSLSEAVRRSGGIKPDISRANAGEYRRISNKETGTTGLINRNAQRNAEEMAQRLWEDGYLRDEFPDYQDIDPNRFLSVLEEDVSGSRKHFSTAKEITIDELDGLSQEEKEQVDAEMRFLADPSVVRLLKEVEDGNEDEGLREELYITASNYGLPDEAVDANLAYSRDVGAERQLRQASPESPQVQSDTDQGRPLNTSTSEPIYKRMKESSTPISDSQRDLATQRGRVIRPPTDVTKGDVRSAAKRVLNEKGKPVDSAIADRNRLPSNVKVYPSRQGYRVIVDGVKIATSSFPAEAEAIKAYLSGTKTEKDYRLADRLSDLAETDDAGRPKHSDGPLIEKLAYKYKRGTLYVNPEGAELIRRIQQKVMALKHRGLFSGTFLTHDAAYDIWYEVNQNIAPNLKPEAAVKLKAFAKELDNITGDTTQGVPVAVVLEGDLMRTRGSVEHERTHQASTVASGNKPRSQRYNVKGLLEEPEIKKGVDNLRSERYRRASDDLAIEEFMATAASRNAEENLGLTPEEVDSGLAKIFESFARYNGGSRSLENFQRLRPASRRVRDEVIRRVKEREQARGIERSPSSPVRSISAGRQRGDGESPQEAIRGRQKERLASPSTNILRSPSRSGEAGFIRIPPLPKRTPSVLKDTTVFDRFRTPLSNLNFKGTYERRGQARGRIVSDAIKRAQYEVEDRINAFEKAFKASPQYRALTPKQRQAYLETAEKQLRTGAIKSLRAFLKPHIDSFKKNGKPGLAEDIEIQLDQIAGIPSSSEKAVGRMVKQTPGLQGVQNPDRAMRTLATKIQRIQSTLKLKYNIKSSVVNLTDPLSTLWPYVSTVDFAAVYAKFLTPSAQKMLRDRGILKTTTKMDEGVIRRAGRFSPFGAASRVNQGVGYLYGLKEAERLGLTGQQAHLHAKDWVKKVEFDNSTWNAPPILRTVGGKVFLQFKGYQMKAMENLFTVLKSNPNDRIPLLSRGSRVAKFGVGKGVVGGVKAFGMLAKYAVGVALVGALIEYLKQAGISEDDAQQWAEAVYFGTPSLLGIDLSGSVMMFEEPYGDTPAEKVISTVGGPTVSDALTLTKGARDIVNAKDTKKSSQEEKIDSAMLRTAKRITPYVRMAEAAYGTAVGNPTIRLDASEEGVSMFEGVMRSLGFTLTKQSEYYEKKDAGLLKEEKPSRVRPSR